MIDLNCWWYKGECLYEPPDGYAGFVYLITDNIGKKYWGKKAFTHKVKSKLSKKARVGTRKRIKVVHKDSKWLSYWGSCKPLLEYIKQRGSTDGFKREILYLCKDKREMAYRELEVLVKNDALEINCWNTNILGRFFKPKQ